MGHCPVEPVLLFNFPKNGRTKRKRNRGGRAGYVLHRKLELVHLARKLPRRARSARLETLIKSRSEVGFEFPRAAGALNGMCLTYFLSDGGTVSHQPMESCGQPRFCASNSNHALYVCLTTRTLRSAEVGADACQL